jgi:hemolysin activation/secretion protein
MLTGLVCCSWSAMAAESGSKEFPVFMNPSAAGPGKLYTLAGIMLTRVELSDNDLVSTEELERSVASYKGKEVSFEQLEAIRHELSRVIIAKGYINSGVIIPDQEVKDGVVRFLLIRGSLTSVELEGNRHFAAGYLKGKIKRDTRTLLNVNVLQENLQLLQLDPRIKTIKAELKPGDKQGESILKTRVEENPPLRLMLESGNCEPPSTGSYSGYATVSYSNLIGTGDTIEARFGFTEGNQDYGGRISIPVNSLDTTFEAFFRKGESTVVDDLFKDLNIKSTSDTYGTRIVQPLYQSLRQKLRFSLAGEYRTSATSLLGRKFSFSPGAVEGESKASVIRFSQEYVNRGSSHVLALSSAVSFGIDALGATIHTNGEPDGIFISWLAQFLFIWQIDQTQLVFRTDTQLANDQLLTMEKFSVGGINSVRGYRKSLLVRDNGVNGTLEARLPLANNRRGEPVLFFIPFYDYGYAWDNVDNPDQRNAFIHSIGGGLKWSPCKNANIEFYYGYALREIHVTDHDPQDYGIHFNVSWQLI